MVSSVPSRYPGQSPHLEILASHSCKTPLALKMVFTGPGDQVVAIFGGPLCNWRRQWQPPPVLLPGKSHGQRGLVGCSPWGRWESDTTERLHFYFSLSCIGEGNGNPLQCSCLENPRDGGAWWAAVYGVAQSRTRLKQLSSRSSSIMQLTTLHMALYCLIRYRHWPHVGIEHWKMQLTWIAVHCKSIEI